jgi:type I restriction enzyme M protein
MVITHELDLSTLEGWLWDAACSIRGPIDAPKYRDYILPLLFYKRLSDVYEDEIARLAKEFGDAGFAREMAEADRDLTRVYIPDEYLWGEIRTSPENLGDRLTTAVREIAKENEDLQGVIDIVDYNVTTAGRRLLDDGTLSELLEVLSRHRLGLRDAEPDILGRAYEYLLRKFAEGSGQSAGEFYTPMGLATLMSYIIDPQQGESVHDPASGSAGLLIKCQLRLEEVGFPMKITTENEREFIRKAVDALGTQDSRACEILIRIVRFNPQNQRAWMYLALAVDEFEKSKSCLRRTLDINPANSMARKILQVYEQENQSQNSGSMSLGNEILKIAINLQQAKSQSAQIEELDGYEFEELITDLLNRMGFRTEPTNKASDGGIDIVAYSDEAITSGKYIIQCKRYSGSIGEPIIRDLYGVVNHTNATKGILITNSYFTKAAKGFAAGKPIELIGGDKLSELMSDYGFGRQQLSQPNKPISIIIPEPGCFGFRRVSPTSRGIMSRKREVESCQI